MKAVTAGNTDTITMPTTMNDSFCLTNGLLPNR